MFSKTVEFYDLIYSEWKDYEGEAERLAALLKLEAPGGTRILDVGCGPGRHAEILGRLGFQVDGIDLEPGFVEIAAGRCPQGRFSVADMAAFDLGRTYDAVVCLFSAIGYVETPERLRTAAASMARHVRPGGLVVIEPWFAPGAFQGGSLHLTTVDRPDLKVARVSRSQVAGAVSVLDFHYLVARAEGVEHWEELHRLGLFTVEEMTEALTLAGLESVRFEPEGLIGRGLYLGTRPAP